MPVKNILKKSVLWSLCFLSVTGCVAPLKYVIARKARAGIPQVVAYLQPAVENDRIQISGKIVLQNMQDFDLKPGRVFIEVRDENGRLLDKTDFDWQARDAAHKQETQAFLDISLPLTILSRKQIVLFLSTEVFYEALGVTLPIKSKLAVLDLAMLKKTIVRPLDVAVHTRIYCDISGNTSADFVFDIANPTGAGLVLREGLVKIYTREKGDIARMAVPPIVFKPGEKKHIQDKMDLGNIFKTVMTQKILSVYPLRIKMSGELAIPGTDIFMPFSIEAVQEFDFSLLPRKGR